MGLRWMSQIEKDMQPVSLFAECQVANRQGMSRAWLLTLLLGSTMALDNGAGLVPPSMLAWCSVSDRNLQERERERER